jgi:phenylalanyl-tRNA synthetase beta chain
MLVVWLAPGVTVPDSRDTDPFVLGARELRGVLSNGMLASPRELTISDRHEGILEVIADDDEAIEPGMLLVDAYHLRGDVIIDIENKMFTHRPDCFGFIGIARELAGIQGQAYKSPAWYVRNPEFPGLETDELKLEVRNELPELVPRFTAITMRGVKVGPSPLWLQLDLAKAGLRPINNIVDYTNFFMLETGQPLHAYDYDKVVAQDEGADHATIVIRKPKKGEKILLLNDKEVEPREDAVMIATRDALIGIGGVMGGGDTEVDENTKNIIIECANFDMYSIRRTSMAHGLFTDAVTRFNKGQSPLQNLAVLAKITNEIRTFAGGKVASAVIDDNHVATEVLERGSVHPSVALTTQFINERLGLELSAEKIKTLLENVECRVQLQGEDLTVIAPFWRTDIEIPEDVVEEVGRLYGYDKLPLTLPKRTITPAKREPMLELKQRIRESLSKAGANEVLTYSFVHGNLIDKTTQDKGSAFELSNALSPDLQYYRLSLTPSLLEKVHANIKAGYSNFALFEMGRAHHTAFMDDENLPCEFDRLAFVYAADSKKAKKTGAAYFSAKKYLDKLLDVVGSSRSITVRPLADFGEHDAIQQMCEPFEPNRSAVLWSGTMIVGVVGEYKAKVAKALKLPDHSAGFETFMSLFTQNSTGTAYVALPRFPKIEQDICLKVPSETTYQDVFDFVWKEIEARKAPETLATLSPVDIYQREGDAEHKQITVRLSIASYERTMTDAEVSKLLDSVATAVAESLQAERV